MNKKELIEDVTKTIKFFHEFIDEIQRKKVEKGYMSEVDDNIKNKKGVCIIDTKAEEYNLYNYKQFKALMNFITHINKLKLDIVGIKDKHIYYFYINFCNSMVDTADRILAEQLLFPVLSFLTGETSDKNRYTINVH